MVCSSIDLQFSIHRTAQLSFGEHATHGLFDESGRLFSANDLRELFSKPTRIAGVPSIELLVFFITGQLDLRGIDNDDVVTGVDERCVLRTVLALK